MEELNKILELDKRIRFVAKISYGGEFLDSVFRSDLSLHIGAEQQKSMGIHVSIMADTHRRVDNSYGASRVSITLRPKMITVLFYAEDDLYSISLDACANYPELVKKIGHELSIPI